jgi:hypothetical protein
MRLLEVVLPNTQHMPPTSPQLTRHFHVTRVVTFPLGVPELPVGVRSTVAFWATMPETTVHKHAESHFAENKIGIPKEHLPPSPAFKSMLPKDFNYPKLCPLVVTGADARHQLTSRQSREKRAHEISE